MPDAVLQQFAMSLDACAKALEACAAALRAIEARPTDPPLRAVAPLDAAPAVATTPSGEGHPKMQPAWLDLRHGAAYTSLSVKTLRRHLHSATHTLPARRVGGRWLMSQEDLDRWVKSFEQAGERRDQLVEEMLRDLATVPVVREKDK